MFLEILAPLITLITMIIGMTHQIKIILEIDRKILSREEINRRLDILSMPRILLGTFASSIWILYGIQIKNYYMLTMNIVGIVLNVCLAYVIWSVRKKFVSR